MTQRDRNARWENEPKWEAHTCLASVFGVVREECAWRVDADEYHLGLYCSSDRPGVKGRSRRGYEYGPSTLPYNICRGAVDTLQAKASQQRPLPEVLTQRGNWKNQKRAKKQSQFLEGEFYRQRIHEQHAKMIVRDALIFGRGALKVWTEGKRIKVERAHPWELYADEWDARYGSPRNLYHCRSVDKGVLLEQFARTESGGWLKSVREAIESAGRFDLDDDWGESGGSTVDRIDIIEAWHLCDRPEEHERGEDADDDWNTDEATGEPQPDDEPKEPAVGQGAQPRKHKCTGRHVVVTTAGTLIDEPWEHDYFPYVVLSYNDATVGCWGHGLVEQLEGYQYEINSSSERLSEMYHLSGVHVFVPDTAKIHDTAIRNGITMTRHAAGGKPEVHQMDLVNEHVRARPRELMEDGLNDTGLSQMSAQSEKPAGVTAAVALQTLNDVETLRFGPFMRAFETWCLEIGRRFVDCAKQIAASYGDHAVTVPMKGGFLKLRWSDVYVDGIELRVFATSLLPQQIGARLEKLMQLWESEVIDRATFLRHLDAPDMQAEMDLETADKLVIDEMIDRMLEADEDEGDSAYLPPSAYQDYAWAARRAQQKYNRALLDGAPEYNLAFLRRYIKQCDEEMKKLAPPQAPGPMPMPGAEPAAPAPIVPAAGAMPADPAAPPMMAA